LGGDGGKEGGGATNRSSKPDGVEKLLKGGSICGGVLGGWGDGGGAGDWGARGEVRSMRKG